MMPTPSDVSHPLARHGCSPAELQRLHAARRVADAMLAWRNDQGALILRRLEDATEYVIGRRPHMPVAVTWDSMVSRLHARVRCIGGEWVVADRPRSKNGTFVNGVRVIESTRLADGDVLRVGRTLLVFEHSDPDTDLEPTQADDGDLLPVCRDDLDRRILVALCRSYVVERRPQPVDNHTIAAEVHQSVHTVRARLKAMYRSTGIALGRGSNRAELVRRVVDHGLIGERDYP